AQGVNLRAVEAVKAVELHRRERRAQFADLGSRLLKFSALVVGADDKHAHVVPARGLHGGPVQVVDEIPVEVDVIKFASVDGLQNDVRGAVRGKTDEAAAAFLLQLACDGETAVFLKRPVECLPVVDAVERKQVH